ncbi:hypothetical protein CORC01_07482, partial [Colletotrichum orchidophilum]
TPGTTDEQDGQVLYPTHAVLSNSWFLPATLRYEKVLAPALWGYIVACEYLSQEVVTRVLATDANSQSRLSTSQEQLNKLLAVTLPRCCMVMAGRTIS